MTNKELLHADLLDIIFEHRNKMYGAYLLRREYPARMIKALLFTMGAAGLVFWGMRTMAGQRAGGAEGRIDPETIVVATLPPDVPEPPPPVDPPPPQDPVAQTRYTSDIRIVPDEVPTDVPEVRDLETTLIGTANIDGRSLIDPNERPAQSPLVAKGLGDQQGQDEDPGIVPVEIQPQFPGGMEAFSAFLARYLQCPEDLDPGQKKTVLVTFKVGTDGAISEFRVVQSAGNSFDREVIRVLKKMPKWKPAVQNGHKVPVFFTQPVTFVAPEG